VKSEVLYLHHIRERCQRVGGCVRTGRDECFGDVVYQDAVMRNREIIGEAAKHIAPELRVLIHDYPNLDLERVWLVANRDFPELLRVIEDFLRERGGI